MEGFLGKSGGRKKLRKRGEQKSCGFKKELMAGDLPLSNLGGGEGWLKNSSVPGKHKGGRSNIPIIKSRGKYGGLGYYITVNKG